MKTTRTKKSYDQLISGYYGKGKLFTNKRNDANFVISTSVDNGETLIQKPKNNFLEYVVQSSLTIDTPFEEYVVSKATVNNVSKSYSVDVPNNYAPTYTVAQETQTDVINPLQNDSSKLAMLDRLSDSNASETTVETIAVAKPAIITTPATLHAPVSNAPVQNNSPSIQSSYTEDAFNDLSQSVSTNSDDDFVKDMQAILTGEKVFDAVHKKTVDKSQATPTSKAQSETPSLPQMENKHAIFDQIAQSMEYAKAYDLGDINLEKRFNDFDKILDIEKSISSEKKNTPKNTNTTNYKKEEHLVGNEEFIKDMDVISKAASVNKTPLQSTELSTADYSYAQNPAAIIAGISAVDAASLGLSAVAIVQAQVSATQGSFSLSYDKAQRILTTEARAQMPGSQSEKKSYAKTLFFIGGIRVGTAEATVVIEWEGNAYGEIGTPVIRRDLKSSTEWSSSSANLTITKIDRIPAAQSDPRTWALIYTYEGTYNPFGNGYFEFSGEFEINAFGGLKFNRHEVVSRSLIDLTLLSQPTSYVQRGIDEIVSTPIIPAEQMAYLRSRLP
jgi:hypothetical protein